MIAIDMAKATANQGVSTRSCSVPRMVCSGLSSWRWCWRRTVSDRSPISVARNGYRLHQIDPRTTIDILNGYEWVLRSTSLRTASDLSCIAGPDLARSGRGVSR